MNASSLRGTAGVSRDVHVADGEADLARALAAVERELAAGAHA